MTGCISLFGREKYGLKKVSGRWGFRPLGRGDGGKRNLKLFLNFLSLCCAREQHIGTQEQP
jgi:hypothetical protein